MDTKTLVDYASSLDCIHCGLCLRTCPTYRLTGVESASPRGRIHLMRAVAEGSLDATPEFAEEMDACLVCRNCESVCPSGVRFGAMMETTRDGLERATPRAPHVRFARWLGFRVVLPHRLALSLSAFGLRLAQRTGLTWLAARLLGERGRALHATPEVPPLHERRRLASVIPARGEARSRAAVLQGCVMPELLGRVNRATVSVLSACDVECRIPDHTCCGALHAHNGDLAGARALARETIRAFENVRDLDGSPAPIVVNSAGCGAHMKEFAHLLAEDGPWRERAERFAARVRDFTEFTADPARLGVLGPRLGATREQASVTYDDPCHLCHGQGVRSEPRTLIDRIPGTARHELEESESCCGSAGIFSLLRPADSNGILEPRLDALAATGAETLVTANPGCHLQWQTGIARRGAHTEVLHVAELLERSLKAGPSR